MAIGENAKAFLAENVVYDEDHMGHVTQKKYLEFMSSCGVTKDVLDAVNNAHSDLYNGMYQQNVDTIKKMVGEAKKNGVDASSQKTGISINIPFGSVTMNTTAAKTYPIPRQTGETITKPLVTTLDIRQVRHIDKEMAKSSEDEIRKLLGI